MPKRKLQIHTTEKCEDKQAVGLGGCGVGMLVPTKDFCHRCVLIPHKRCLTLLDVKCPICALNGTAIIMTVFTKMFADTPPSDR